MNEREFSNRVRSMRDRLWRVSFSIVRSAADAEDAMQEALLRAWRNVDSLRDKSLFEALGRDDPRNLVDRAVAVEGHPVQNKTIDRHEPQPP